MANGDIIMLDQHRLAIKLLDAQSTTHTGVWVEIPAWFNIRSFWMDALEATGSALSIMVSNAATKPADGTDGAVETFTAFASPGPSAGTAIDAYRWVKAKKTQGAVPAPTTVIVECARNE